MAGYIEVPLKRFLRECSQLSYIYGGKYQRDKMKCEENFVIYSHLKDSSFTTVMKEMQHCKIGM